MAEKDITEKTLEGYNDVFADIVNALLFDGKKVVDPNDLEDQDPHSFYKADGKIRELERDVAKRWKKNNIRIACIGMENQTNPDPWMALRVAGYDGAEYRAQVNKLDEGLDPYPVITIVLYFGYKKRWDQPISLFDALKVSEELKPYVNDVKLNLFEIAYLSHEQVELFQSDFKVVADYFVQMCEHGDYQPSTHELDHIQAVMQLLNVMEKDHRFEKKLNDDTGKGTVKTMADWLTKRLNESEAQGWKDGKAQGWKDGEETGIKKGENRMASLMKTLLNQGRIEDAGRAAEDAEFRDRLYQELQIA